jgi:hypothetical protein
MKTKFPAILTSAILVASLALTTGCASDQKITVLAPVGPDSPHPTENKTAGTLVVYSDTESPIMTSEVMYYPHSGYKIYDSRGAYVKYVPNHVSATDESPSRVSLPAGNYTIRARSEINGEVSVPVVIKGLRTTVVNLEKRSHDTTATS